MFKAFTILITLTSFIAMAQYQQSIHETQLESYNNLGNDNANFYENNIPYSPQAQTKYNGCTLNKMVYGWHPYWAGNDYLNYEWDLLSHMSFFSYEVDKNTGNAVTTHGWASAAAVDAALANNTKVTLCVTLFGSSNLTTFLTNSSAKQTLISNLITLIQTRGAHGVNIDFEGLPATQKTNFANFMVDLSNQMHNAIPNSEVSSVLYAVDWNNVFDFSIMTPAVDYFIVMGYDYYYQGSSNSGPNDPLYHFGANYNYSLSKSVTNYLDAGCPKSKLILGLPYYGYQWSTTNNTVPTTTTSSGVAKFYNVVKDNVSGNYSNINHQFNSDSYTDIYVFQQSGVWKQCFITEENAFRKRLQHVNNTGIAGIGIWALGYDDGYDDYWYAINDFLTDCKTDSCSGIIHDFGGPNKNYYDNEDYTWTIAPESATSINLSFSMFNVELNYDTLWVYDGLNTAGTLIGSYTGTNTPGNFSTNSGAVTFRFKSDGGITAPGFNATYTCTVDNTPPITSIVLANDWETSDFTTTFTDTDDQSISESFYLVSDFDGINWKANQTNGFLVDSFTTTLSADWISQVGSWSIVASELYQADQAESNSNIYTNVTQNSFQSYLYHWKGEINGSGANRRAGIHFFCSDPTLTQRGDSYMVYWRADNNKCQIYKSTANNMTIKTDDVVTVDPDITYDFKILYNPQNGNIKAYLNDELVSEWTDPNPLSNGNSLSLRTGNCIGIFDDFKIYKSRNTTELVTVASNMDNVRYENQNPATPSSNILSLVVDATNNWSMLASEYQKIDWTIPEGLGQVNDGLSSDISVFNTSNEISSNWSVFTDTNSNISSYWYAVGTSSGATDIINWTSNNLNTTFTSVGLSLLVGTTYYISVKAINGAGLESAIVTSDGQELVSGVLPPSSSFVIVDDLTICSGEGLLFNNTSSNATTYLWDFGNGTTSTDVNPTVYYTVNGSYTVTLTAFEGATNNQTSQTIQINIVNKPVSNFITTSPVYIPNSTIYFTNNSSNSNSQVWNFGDGNNSTDSNPWHIYAAEGIYFVTLTVSNGICADSVTTQTVEVINSVGLNNPDKVSVKLYPNPANEYFILEFGVIVPESNILVHDISGKLVKEVLTKNTLKQNISLSSLSNGVYFITIKLNEQTQMFKLIKQ